MPKKKDAAIIGVVLLLAVALFAVSKMMPKTDLSTKTADVTLAPDAVEYLDETPAPEATAEPQPTEAPEITGRAAAVGSAGNYGRTDRRAGEREHGRSGDAQADR